MTEGDFPFRSFNLRPEGYDRGEVDAYIGELQSEITELRQALETATPASEADGDIRLHDPEGAVTRTLAIAQETADRVLHDAQVEAERRRSEADEHATSVMAEADERAARLLGEMEAQAAEVREQGVAAARSAIQVERDKAMAELAHVRRVRDDLRTEAVDLKDALDSYRSQAREASDTLAAAASGPLMTVELPDFIDDDVVLAGITSDAESQLGLVDEPVDDVFEATEHDQAPAPSELFSADVSDDDGELAEVISIDADPGFADAAAETVIIPSASIETESDDFGGTFLSEVQAAAESDVQPLPPENEGGDDRFLSELRGLASEDDDLDSEAADRFFDSDD